VAPPFGSKGRRRNDQQRGSPSRDRGRRPGEEGDRRGARSYRPGLHDWTPGAAGRSPSASGAGGRGPASAPLRSGGSPGRAGTSANGGRGAGGGSVARPGRSYLRPGSMGGASAGQRESYERDGGLGDERDQQQRTSQPAFPRRRSLAPGRPPREGVTPSAARNGRDPLGPGRGRNPPGARAEDRRGDESRPRQPARPGLPSRRTGQPASAPAASERGQTHAGRDGGAATPAAPPVTASLRQRGENAGVRAVRSGRRGSAEGAAPAHDRAEHVAAERREAASRPPRARRGGASPDRA